MYVTGNCSHLTENCSVRKLETNLQTVKKLTQINSFRRDFATNFIGKNWGHNGPGVLTRVLKQICGVKYTTDMSPEKCWQFKVYPPDAFYAINSGDWQMFFDANSTQETLKLTNRSMIVHVWNKMSSNQSIRKTAAETAYEIIASKNCPRVFQASGEQF